MSRRVASARAEKMRSKSVAVCTDTTIWLYGGVVKRQFGVRPRALRERRNPCDYRAMSFVRRATNHDIDATAQVLAAAFQDDPGTIVIEPDSARRARLLPPF